MQAVEHNERLAGVRAIATAGIAVTLSAHPGNGPMSHLLTPGDERDLVAFLCETLEAKLLLSDLTTAGKPHLATDALAALPEALPGPAAFGDHAVRTLIFWLPRVGPIRTLADAPPPATPPDGVARRVSIAAAGGRAVDLIDLSSNCGLAAEAFRPDTAH
jgi:hypothetical protein